MIVIRAIILAMIYPQILVMIYPQIRVINHQIIQQIMKSFANHKKNKEYIDYFRYTFYLLFPNSFIIW